MFKSTHKPLTAEQQDTLVSGMNKAIAVAGVRETVKRLESLSAKLGGVSSKDSVRKRLSPGVI